MSHEVCIARLTDATEEKRPRLEKETSTASSTSIGSGTEGREHSFNKLDDKRRGVDSWGTVAPYSNVGRHPSPSSVVRGGSSLTAEMAGSSASAGPSLPILTSSPPISPESSANFPRSSVESIQDQTFSPSRGLQHLPRILPNHSHSPSTSHSSLTPTDPRYSSMRNSSITSPNQLPPLIHESSDNSKSSNGSNQSSGSTAASSLHGHRGSEDEAKPQIMLPPLSTVALLPHGVPSLADHAFRPSPSLSLGIGSMPLGSHQTSQSTFSQSSGVYSAQTNARAHHHVGP